MPFTISDAPSVSTGVGAETLAVAQEQTNVGADMVAITAFSAVNNAVQKTTKEATRNGANSISDSTRVS
jgi:hypothetical protein